MFAYLIELITQEEIRYKKNPDAYNEELKKYTINLSSQITVPANRVNAFMAMSIMGVASTRKAIIDLKS